jgi:hypothetical protein
MKLGLITNMVNQAFYYVIQSSQKYHIDESHALKHSMEVLHNAHKIYQSELITNPFLEKQKDVIFSSAILHDMCDKKYMDEQIGVLEMQKYMKKYIEPDNLNMISTIVSTMSYSKVIKYGYPHLGDHQLAYHIVREADLLAAYDVDRCIIYQMMRNKFNYVDSLQVAIDLFDKRVFQYIENDLFVTNYSKQKASELHLKAIEDIHNIQKIKNML